MITRKIIFSNIFFCNQQKSEINERERFKEPIKLSILWLFPPAHSAVKQQNPNPCVTVSIILILIPSIRHFLLFKLYKN